MSKHDPYDKIVSNCITIQQAMQWWIEDRSPFAGVPKMNMWNRAWLNCMENALLRRQEQRLYMYSFNHKLEERVSRGSRTGANIAPKNNTVDGRPIKVTPYSVKKFGDADPERVAKLQEMEELPLLAHARSMAKSNTWSFLEEVGDQASKSAFHATDYMYMYNGEVKKNEPLVWLENGLKTFVSWKESEQHFITHLGPVQRCKHVCQYPLCRFVGKYMYMSMYSSGLSGTYASASEATDPREHAGWKPARCDAHQQMPTPTKKPSRIKSVPCYNRKGGQKSGKSKYRRVTFEEQRMATT